MRNSMVHPLTQVKVWGVYNEKAGTLEDNNFLSSVLYDCSKDSEEFLNVKCPHCHEIFNLGDVGYSGNNPICPHCGFN